MCTVPLISFFIITILSFWLLKRWRNRKTFPGPVGKPFVGVLFDFDLTTLHLKLYEWSQQHGNVFEFAVMGQRFIVLNCSDAAREIFLKEPNASIAAARPSTFFGKYLQENYEDVFFASPDSKWTKRRKLVHRLLHAYGEDLVNNEHQIKQNLVGLIKEIQNLHDQCFDPRSNVEEFILNGIENLMTGNCTGRDSEMHRIMKQFDHISNDLGNVGIDMLYSFFPFLRFLPLSYSQKIKEWFKLKQQFIGTLEKQAVHDAGKKGIYHSLKKITQEKDSHGQQWFTDVNVHCLLINVVTGGYLTTRGALLSLIQILAKRPELQRAMQDEIDSVTGTTREPALADRHQCHLVEAVTLETLRYISHGVITPHCTSQATEILGVPVGKNTPILLNFWTIHHNAEEWQEPFSFRPERFLDKDGSLLPSTDPVRKRMIVFGLGKRSCVGEAFARARMFLFVATVLQSFTITEPDDADLSDLLPREMETGHILQPKPYKVRFILREK